MITDQEKLNGKGVYVFMEDFTDESCKKAIEFILAANITGQAKEIKLIIASWGGCTDPCFALIDVIYGSKIPISTVGIGMVSSCGLLLFMAGEKGKRLITPRVSILSHQHSGGIRAKDHELIAFTDNMKKTRTMIMDHYKKCTGLNEKIIKKHLLTPTDVWLTAKEAVKFGLADKIVLNY